VREIGGIGLRREARGDDGEDDGEYLRDHHGVRPFD